MGEHTEHRPSLDPERRLIELPIHEVVVLEDRATVTRRGQLVATAGRQQLSIEGVAPVLQDVSLRAELRAGAARIADVRVRRALRIRQAERPAAIRALEEEGEALSGRLRAAGERGWRAVQRHQRLWEMLIQGAVEIPQDAAWGRVDPDAWRHTFGALFERARAQQEQLLDAHFEAEDLASELAALALRIQLAGRPDVRVAAWIELDLVVDEPGPIELSASYVVPNAMWRPLHTAELRQVDGADVLRHVVRAGVWQNTGEDWGGVRLLLSTARSSSATEPPLLSDDLLKVQRRAEEVSLEAREVEVQTTGPDSGGAPEPRAIDLPGVDDGGEVRLLPAPGASVVPSDGAPAFFDLWSFEAPAKVERIAIPERDPRVIVRCEAINEGQRPLLAGPVELVLDHGAIGWTETRFVPPGGALELSFGPDDTLRLQREERLSRDEVDQVDKWRRRDQRVDLYLSNLGLSPRTLSITERVPVSEVEEVRIELQAGTTGAVKPDADGFVRWSRTLEPGARDHISLRFQVATAPGVDFG